MNQALNQVPGRKFDLWGVLHSVKSRGANRTVQAVPGAKSVPRTSTAIATAMLNLLGWSTALAGEGADFFVSNWTNSTVSAVYSEATAYLTRGMPQRIEDSVIGSGTATVHGEALVQGTIISSGAQTTFMATADAWSMSRPGVSRGFAEAVAPSTPGVRWSSISGNATFDTGWKDVLTITGGTGKGTLAVSGHFDGYVEGFSQADFSMYVGNSASNSGITYYVRSNSGSLSTCRNCTSTFVDGAPGEVSRVDFTLTREFTYGSPVNMYAILSGTASEDHGKYGLVDMSSTAMLDSLVLPQGAMVSTASGELELQDGVYRYIATSVPEPASMFCY